MTFDGIEQLSDAGIRAQTYYVLEHAQWVKGSPRPNHIALILKAKGVLADEHVDHGVIRPEAYETIRDVIDRNVGDPDE